MAAKLRVAVCLCGLIVWGGCTWTPLGPGTRQEKPEEFEPDDPPMVVQKPTSEDQQQTEATDPTDQRILDYVRNIDGVARLVGQEPPEPTPTGTQSVDPAGAGLAADARPAVRFEPERNAADARGGGEGTAGGVSQPVGSATTPPAPLEPPVLAAVEVRAERSPIAGDVGPSQQAPAVNAPAVAMYQPASLRDFVERWTSRPADGSFQQQLDARLLHAATGDYERARQPLDLVSDEQQRLAAGFIETYILLRERTLGDDPTETANAALQRIEQLADELRPFSAPTISTFVLCRAVHGFGRYDPIEPPSFPTGIPIEFVTYCEVRHFASQPQTDGTHRACFDMLTTILTRDGTTIREVADRDIVDVCHSRRHDCFIPRLIRLPPTLSPGEYVVKVKIIDKLARKVAAEYATFRVVAGQ
jgi:hypothetical protein